MKTRLSFIFGLLTFCLSLGAFAQSSPQTMSRIRDGALPNNLANVYQFQITFPTTYYGLFTASGTYYFDGTSGTFRRWWGSTQPADGVLNTAVPSPYVQNFPSLWDPINLRWNRQTVYAAGDGLSATLDGTPVLSLGTFYDGTNYRRWRGAAASSDAVVTTTVAPYVNGLNMYYSTSTVWRRNIGGPLADNLLGTRDMPWTGAYNLFYDTSDQFYKRWRGETVDDAMTAAPVAPFVGAYNLFYDGANSRRWTGEAIDDSMTAAPVAPFTASYGVFYDGTNARRWVGATIDDDMTADPVAPWVAAYGVFRNLDGGPIGSQRISGESWDGAMTMTPVNPNINAWNVFYNADTNKGAMWVGETANDTMGGTGPIVIAINGFYNGTNYQRWIGEAWDTDMAVTTNPNVNAFGVFRDLTASKNGQWSGALWSADMTQPLAAPNVNSLGVFRDTTNSKNIWWNGVAANDTMTAAQIAPFVLSLGTFYNGTNYQRWTGTTALPTSVSPMAAPYVGSMSYGYDNVGGLFRPLRTDSSGNLYVNQASLMPGQDSVNDWVKEKTQAVATFTPTVTSTATVDATGTIVILASVEVLSYSNFTITVKNTGGVNAIDNVYVEVGPDGTEWSLIATYDTNIAAGGSARIVSVSNNSDRYLRVRAAATAAVTTSTNCWITGRVAN